MRKNLIAMSVAAFVGGLGMAGGAAAAVWGDTSASSATNATLERVRGSGAGHQLIIPYFNVQNGNATLLNIVNTDLANGKAVKVRFRGGSNSDDVFDFQLYLSPGDVWTATVTRGADGLAQLVTTDKSCTLPSGVGTGANTKFVTARLPQTLTGDALATQTREGYVEIFNMADIPRLQPGAAGVVPADVAANVSPLYTAIKHVGGNAPPCTGTAITNLQNDPATLQAAYDLGFRSPTATLFANWTIVNVPKSGSATGEALAITASIAGVGPAGPTPGRGNIVFFPQTGANASATADSFTADPSLRTTLVTSNGQGGALPGGFVLPVLTASQFDLPDLSTPYLLLGLYPPVAADPGTFVTNLQQALATSSITNEFLTDKNINAFTDWVFSQPTRRYAVAPDYRPLTAAPVGPLVRVFTDNGFYRASNTNVQGLQICASLGVASTTYFNREEVTAVGDSFVISPNPPQPSFSLCGETSVLTFNTATASVLGAEIAKTNLPTGSVVDGWAVVNTPGAVPANGLPIIGKAFSAASTGTLNVGGSWEHRYVPTFP